MDYKKTEEFLEEWKVQLIVMEEDLKIMKSLSLKMDKQQQTFNEIDHKIENLGLEVAKKLNLKDIANQITSSISCIRDADIEVQKLIKNQEKLELKFINGYLIAAISAVLGFALAIVALNTNFLGLFDIVIW